MGTLPAYKSIPLSIYQNYKVQKQQFGPIYQNYYSTDQQQRVGLIRYIGHLLIQRAQLSSMTQALQMIIAHQL